jgi:hypothetical protein
MQRIYLSSDDFYCDSTRTLDFMCVEFLCFNNFFKCGRWFEKEESSELANSSVNLVQQSRFHLRTEAESSLRNVVS